MIDPAPRWYSASWWTAATGIGQIVGALVAALAAWAAAKSAKAAKDAVSVANRSGDISEETMRLNVRPYVTVVDVKLLKPLEAGQPIFTQVQLKNVGSTPALKAELKGGVVIGTIECPVTEADIPNLVYAKRANYLFAPTIQINIEVSQDMPLSEEQMRKIEFGSAELYSWGILTYHDVFGVEHVTKWFFKTIPHSKTTMVATEIHNDMT